MSDSSAEPPVEKEAKVVGNEPGPAESEKVEFHEASLPPWRFWLLALGYVATR